MATIHFGANLHYRSVLQDLTTLEKRVARAAASAALNRAAAKVKTASVREIASTYNIRPQRLVRQRFRSLSRASRHRLIVRFSVGVLPLPAILMNENPARYSAHHFIATMPEGHRGIYHRTGEAKRFPRKGRYAGKGIKREPIAEQTVPIPDAEQIITRHIVTTGAPAWRENFARELEWRLRRGGFR